MTSILVLGASGAFVGALAQRYLSRGSYRRAGDTTRVLHPPPAWACAMVMGALWGITAARAGRPSVLFAAALLAAAGGVLAWIDIDVHRIPNRHLAWLTGALLTLITVAAVTSADLAGLGRSLAAAAALFAGLLALALTPRAGIGMGDVKAMIPIGLATGWASWQTALFALVAALILNGLIAGLLLALHRVTRTARIPMGPSLFTGALLALITLSS